MKSIKMMLNETVGEDGGSGITIEIDPPLTMRTGSSGGVGGGGTTTRHQMASQGFFPTTMHSRSASWSFTGTTRPSASDFSSGLASINPIRSVIREFVPSLGPTRETNTPSHPPSRSNSQSSLPRLSSLRDETPPRNLTSLGFSTHSTSSTLLNRESTGPEFVESLATDNNNNNNREQPFADGGGVGVANGGAGLLNGTADGGEEGGGGEISDWVKWVEQNVIFILVLAIRYAWMHRSGLLVLIGMFATYLHCNLTIKKQVALKNRREKRMLVLVILFLCSNIYFVYYVFSDYKLLNCLVFMPPRLFLDLWTLIWCIYLTDFIIRFGTMVLKALVVICFLRILPSRTKGKYYMLLEHISQFYRTLVPTPLWFGFCSNYYDTGAVFAIIITAGYLMIKGTVILASGRELFRAICTFIHDKTYGTPLKREELLESCDLSCPICQDDYNNPIMLRCRHVFCENCVLQWFDRERTCPLCRASIAADPKWRDGSTSAWPQLF